MKYNNVPVILFCVYSVFSIQRIYGIRKIPDLKSNNITELNIKEIGEDYYDNERKRISERYIRFNSKYKPLRFKSPASEHSVTNSYYDEVPSGSVFRYKYQPLIGNKIVGVKDVRVRQKTSNLFDMNDPLTDISQNTYNENDNLLSNSLESELKVDPIIEIPKPKIEKRKEFAFVRKPHRYFSKLYKFPTDDIDDPIKDISYVLKDFSSEGAQMNDIETKIKPVTNDKIKPKDINLPTKTQNSISRKKNNKNKYITSNVHSGSNTVYKLHPEIKSPAKDVSVILQENYAPEAEYKFISENEPKIEHIISNIKRPKEESFLDEGYYVDSTVKGKKALKHFTDLYNTETKNKGKLAPVRNNTEENSMTVKIWKALQNIKNWMNDN